MNWTTEHIGRRLGVTPTVRPELRGTPSLTRVSATEAWLQVGDRYVITEIPNRLYGAVVTDEGEVV